MADQPSSPFAGLDKALLRSTHASPPQTDPVPTATTDTTTGQRPKSRPASKPRTPRLASSPDNSHASAQASTLARYPATVIDSIRKALKTPGREVAFVRLTPDEKGALADIVYTYKRQGRKTSETEINRIAVNYIIEDYRTNGANSIIARVMEALLA